MRSSRRWTATRPVARRSSTPLWRWPTGSSPPSTSSCVTSCTAPTARWPGEPLRRGNARVDRLTLGVMGHSSQENEHRLPLHPEHLPRIPEELRGRIYLERGYGERFGV